MTASAAIFVSKRLQRVFMAVLCLMAAQALTLASCSPEPVAMGAAARVSITR